MSLNGHIKSIQSNYNRLTPHERFIAVVEAHSRGDDQEIMNLVKSCPRRKYEAAEWEYRQRLDAAGRLGDLILFHVLTDSVGGYISLDLSHRAAQDEIEADILKIKGVEMLQAAAAYWQGFKLFCGDIGVNFDGFLLYNSYGLNKYGGIKTNGHANQSASIFEAVVRMLEVTEPDAAHIEASRVACHDFWKWAIGPEYNYV